MISSFFQSQPVLVLLMAISLPIIGLSALLAWVSIVASKKNATNLEIKAFGVSLSINATPVNTDRRCKPGIK